jgi:hypothetical protein
MMRLVSHQGWSGRRVRYPSCAILSMVLTGLAFITVVHVAGADNPMFTRMADGQGSMNAVSWAYVEADPAAVVAILPMRAEPPLQASQAFSDTVFLPWVARGYSVESTRSFGVQIYETGPEVLTKTAETGAHWVRLPIQWASIEPANTTPEHYQWPASLDAGLEWLAGQGFEIILTLTANPSWAATYPGGPIDRTEIDELAEFLSAAVAHYSVPPYGVKYWELYNEPDNGDLAYASAGWGYWGNEPVAYAQMLAAVYEPMKTANPGIYVVFGGLSYDNWVEDGGPFVRDFLDRVLEYDPAPPFDIMNFHYYPNFGWRWAPWGIGLIGKTAALREKLASYGINKLFMCTETAEQSSAYPYPPGGDDERQSRYVVQALVRGVAADLETVVWFMLRDDDDPLGPWKTGLLNADLTPKPAFYAYQTLVEQLRPAGYAGTIEPAAYNSELIEGYAFFAPGTSTQILVVWSQDADEHQMTLETERLTIVDKYGGETVRHDEEDGLVDGRVQVNIGIDPVYLRFVGNAQGLGSQHPALDSQAMGGDLDGTQTHRLVKGIP